MEDMRIAVDTSKHVFPVHGVDKAGGAVLRRELRRAQFEAFFAKLPAPLSCLKPVAAHSTGRGD